MVRARLDDPDADVPSPTYTLVQTYDAGGAAIWHADLYRLTDPGEAEELGLLDAFADAICLVEWPERLGPMAPVAALRLHLASAPGDGALDGAGAEGVAVGDEDAVLVLEEEEADLGQVGGLAHAVDADNGHDVRAARVQRRRRRGGDGVDLA